MGATGTGMCRLGAEGAELAAGLLLLLAEACCCQRLGEPSKEPGMCECAGIGAHIRRDWFEVVLGRPFSRMKFANHSFRFSASFARGTAIGLLSVEAKRD